MQGVLVDMTIQAHPNHCAAEWAGLGMVCVQQPPLQLSDDLIHIGPLVDVIHPLRSEKRVRIHHHRPATVHRRNQLVKQAAMVPEPPCEMNQDEYFILISRTVNEPKQDIQFVAVKVRVLELTLVGHTEDLSEQGPVQANGCNELGSQTLSPKEGKRDWLVWSESQLGISLQQTAFR
jgi:hypothetical protein